MAALISSLLGSSLSGHAKRTPCRSIENVPVVREGELAKVFPWTFRRVKALLRFLVLAFTTGRLLSKGAKKKWTNRAFSISAYLGPSGDAGGHNGTRPPWPIRFEGPQGGRRGHVSIRHVPRPLPPSPLIGGMAIPLPDFLLKRPDQLNAVPVFPWIAA